MPFRFVCVCDLLEELQAIQTHDPPYLPRDAERRHRESIEKWFKKHCQRIHNEVNGSALLSILLPDSRTDRVYELREKSLEKIVGRVLALPHSRLVDLGRWRQPGGGDLGDCVERVQKQADMAAQLPGHEVSVEEIDEILLIVASRSRFSSPSVRASAHSNASSDVASLLSVLYSRLQARESKWLTRLILRTYAPIILPEALVYRSYHHLLPGLLKVQDDLDVALSLLADIKNSLAITGTDSSRSRYLDILQIVKPRIGIKVGRQTFFTARSIKHCVDMARNRRMCVEKKYDGEYLQLHVDMSSGPGQRIKIFSKSGRDSTQDRVNIHSVIKQCLRLDESDCKISSKCILEGELLVYSDKDHKILDFHKIRKHVSRSSFFLGTHGDSRHHSFEHLMVVFFDIMALDETPVLGLKQYERRQLLEKLICRIPGRADLSEYHLISFSVQHAAAELRKVFANSIIARDEGLVLKPADEPYFSFDGSREHRSCCIKLKKSYIGNLGEIGDFTIVGAAYDAQKAKSYRVPNLQWTDFYVGCLENKDDVIKWNEKPSFVIVAVVSLKEEIIWSLLQSGKLISLPYESNPYNLRIGKGIAQGEKPATVFAIPFVVEIRCFSFDKNEGTDFWSPRFPEATKLHFDRSYTDTVSFSELQQMAEKERSEPEEETTQENLRWITLLEAVDPSGVAVDATTPRTSSSLAMTPSPERRPQVDHDQQHEALIHIDRMETDLNPEITMFDPAPSYVCGIGSIACQANTAAPLRPRDISTSPLSVRDTNMLQRRPKRRLLQNSAAKGDRPPKRLLTSIIFDDSSSSTVVEMSQEPFQKSGCTLNDGSSNISSVLIQDGRNSLIARSLDAGELSEHMNEKENSMQHPLLAGEEGLDACFENLQANNAPLLIKSSCIAREPRSPVTDTHICRKAGQACILSNCIFIVAPCIANMPWLIENLLPLHGATFFTNPEKLVGHKIFRSLNGVRLRKVVLVESNRHHQTTLMFKTIQNLNLKRSNDKKEWVEVYDWRLLESTTKLETGKELRYDVWRHFWVGAA